jgi:hypothetical protein
MDLDQMKLAWNRMNQLLENQQRQLVQIRLDQELKRVRSSLRPLFWGQVWQIVLGILVILFAVGYWSANIDVWYRLASGIVMHIYGVVVIIMAGITLGCLRDIDYAQPVLTIRRRVARLKSTYVLNGMIVGLPWWLLWILLAVMVAGYGGRDLIADCPQWILWSAAVGVVGLWGTWMFHQWAHRPVRSGWGKRLDAGAAGASINKAQRIIAELEAFENEQGQSNGADRA